MIKRRTIRLCWLVLFIGLPVCGSAADIADVIQKFQFRGIGPTRQGGRVVSFAVSVDDPSMFFGSTRISVGKSRIRPSVIH